MGLNKSKPYFWSQFLLSMIAIFALPTTTEISLPVVSSYSKTQQQNQHLIIQAVALVKQAQQARLPQAKTSAKPQKRLKYQPHFVVAVVNKQTPIRAGPFRS